MNNLHFKHFIAIDPGRSAGGIVLDKNGVVTVYKMPDSLERFNLFLQENITEPENTLCFIEKLSMWRSDNNQPGMQFQIQKMLAHFEQLKAALSFNKIETIQITAQSWQKGLNLVLKGAKEEKPARKKRYKECAQVWYPSFKVSLWNSDALLIHRFMRVKMQTDQRWIFERRQYYKESKMF